jgi:tRNA threonylcarbamoyladenosine biosynthesis protein TsaE
MTRNVLTVETESAEETARLGMLLGRLIEKPVLIRLAGDLGAGKTCFAQGVARGLDIPEDEPVTSPSYTLMNQYSGRLPLYHFDLYRLTGADDLEDLGFSDYLDADGVTVVEWGDRFEENRSEGLFITLIRLDEFRRRLILEAHAAPEWRLIENLDARWRKETAP